MKSDILESNMYLARLWKQYEELVLPIFGEVTRRQHFIVQSSQALLNSTPACVNISSNQPLRPDVLPRAICFKALDTERNRKVRQHIVNASGAHVCNVDLLEELR